MFYVGQVHMINFWSRYSYKEVGDLSDVVAKVLDYDIIVSEFEPQLGDYVHFRTNTREKGAINAILQNGFGIR